ncbi:topology modulation protein [Aquibacillus halophilus]|uniref:Topology modulation protein n=1 Tax=Aquibacillus halophilus TaxID=930132 RepID=A0A6A8DHE0_9BACI|nr:topology modulation protein [Aquibacillus halophilus]MRH45094.1 topology modulation protein [Aquibacillus halophilus]
MKRIMVIGVSAGVGKSTFARKLSASLDINAYHLDAIYWEPGWVETSFNKFSTKQREIVQQEEWIIEGNYSSTFDIRENRADTIIYLQLPLYICVFRVLKRWINNRGKTRIDMGKDCKEKMDWEFLKFIVTTYHKRKAMMEIRLTNFKKKNLSNQVILLKTKRDINSYFN